MTEEVDPELATLKVLLRERERRKLREIQGTAGYNPITGTYNPKRGLRAFVR